MKFSDYIRSSAPIPEALAHEMFTCVFAACVLAASKRESYVGDGGDRDTAFRFTCEFCRTHGLDADKIIPWLESFGAYCDDDLVLQVSIWFLPSDFFNPNSGPEAGDDFFAAK
ncbi:MAG: DUF2695 domain-containing protein [Silvibacterium sp.]